jgi:acetyl-CoA carboxylase carboxyl transferase subunit beta
MSWFKRDEKKTLAADGEKTVRTEGLWQKCESCREIIWKKDLDNTHQVCPRCGAHFRLDARSRLELLFDGGEFEEHDGGLRSSDPLGFVAQKVYLAQLSAAEAATSMNEALISGEGTLDGRKVNICAMEPRFIGGSMGLVMGERITRAVERSILQVAPLIVVSA